MSTCPECKHDSHRRRCDEVPDCPCVTRADRQRAYEIVTSDDLNAATATFDSSAAAQAAADAALPRRTRHNRPYPVRSGYHAVRAGADRWIVWVGNAVLLRDGTMYDYHRGKILR